MGRDSLIWEAGTFYKFNKITHMSDDDPNWTQTQVCTAEFDQWETQFISQRVIIGQ